MAFSDMKLCFVRQKPAFFLKGNFFCAVSKLVRQNEVLFYASQTTFCRHKATFCATLACFCRHVFVQHQL